MLCANDSVLRNSLIPSRFSDAFARIDAGQERSRQRGVLLCGNAAFAATFRRWTSGRFGSSSSCRTRRVKSSFVRASKQGGRIHWRPRRVALSAAVEEATYQRAFPNANLTSSKICHFPLASWLTQTHSCVSEALAKRASERASRSRVSCAK